MTLLEQLKHGFYCPECDRLTEHVKVLNEWVCLEHTQRPDVKEKQREANRRWRQRQQEKLRKILENSTMEATHGLTEK